MDAMSMWFTGALVVGFAAMVVLEEPGMRVWTFFYLMTVLVLGLGAAFLALHWGWL